MASLTPNLDLCGWLTPHSDSFGLSSTTYARKSRVKFIAINCKLTQETMRLITIKNMNGLAARELSSGPPYWPETAKFTFHFGTARLCFLVRISPCGKYSSTVLCLFKTGPKKQAQVQDSHVWKPHLLRPLRLAAVRSHPPRDEMRQ